MANSEHEQVIPAEEKQLTVEVVSEEGAIIRVERIILSEALIKALTAEDVLQIGE